eukprot:TRINITY_DN4254_c0_g1_i4.p1 TRINITY_DN4254_c0_g1~~TRINITY_DN4254_c0_g1_i4.p1  ORF type:complete len:695 (+),score=152.70 TRINITY_DN4254_c0_g1_i4:198-2282(+)
MCIRDRYQTSLFDQTDFTAKMRHSFHQAVKHVSKEAVKSYVLLGTEDLDVQDNLKVMKFRELCQHIQSKHYCCCVKAVFERFWDVMRSHWAMLQHHKHSDANDWLKQVHTPLSELRKSVWDQVKRRVEHLLSFHLATCKVEDMLRVIEYTKKLMDVGELYSESDSTMLRGSIANKTSQYFRSFHQANADELAVVLDNEPWIPIPVRPDFSVRSIKELQVGFSLAHPLKLENTSAPDSAHEWATDPNPFAGLDEGAEGESQALDDEDEGTEQLLLTEIDEDAAPGDVRKPRKRAETVEAGGCTSGLVLTNASMVLIRAIARYIMIMEKLDLGTEALAGLVLLCDLYVYDVFTVAYMHNAELDMSPSLNRMLQVMRNNLRKSPYYAPRFPPPPSEAPAEKTRSIFSMKKSEDKEVKADWPCPCTVMANLDSPDDLFGLHHRYTALKSLSFLRQVLESVRVRLSERFLKGASSSSVAQASLLNDFYSNVERNVELEYALLRNIAKSMIKLDHIPDQINKCAWDTLELAGTDGELRGHDFVPAMLAEAKVFFSRLDSGLLNEYGMGAEATETIVKAAIEACMAIMVEGFSRVKKCTNEGRVTMSFDLKQFQMGLQEMTSIRPIPSVQLVEEFIKGFFVLNDCNGEVEVMDWVVKHVHDYSEEQVKSLLMVSYVTFKNLKRKTRNDLLESVSQHYKELL